MLLALAVPVSSAVTIAAEYPDRPLRLVVSFPPGGSGDFQARILGPKLTEQIGQQVIVDNRAGGSGVVALDLVAKSAANGYNLLLGPMSALTVNPALYSRLPYDTLRDFAPISLTARTTLALAVGASLPANSVRELIALAKASPGKLSFGSTGAGSVTHLVGEILKSLAGIDIVHVPYKGAGPQLVDVMSGNVAMGFVSLTAALPHVRTGRLKVLMVTGKQRSSVAPDVQTATEAGVGELDISHGWFGILAPTHTPKAVLSRLNTEIVKAVQAPDVQTRFRGQGLEPSASTADDFSALIKSDLVRWAKIVKEAGLRAE
jgi:tripartite-type tricarboxylate transporter receptor subunit TctC